ncbi:EF-P beta-lysylation protein EpmB [Aliikangiella marina]|uniref:L-lysine 2,3-aminomutase n=2 Tax=Aliikangiella marina TaxID=1712262 RepID=A0A545T7N6_9GAMM|nr:EF-P beta-lysylation protein EpmB [Aliikangiella marina]
MSPIIPVSQVDCQVPAWKKLLKTAIKDPLTLLETVAVDPKSLDFSLSENNPFSTRVPQPFIDKMKPGDAKDPLLLQVLTSHLEELEVPDYSFDPLDETQNQLPGLLHKYHGRVLLILAAACAVNCRYCFRRHFPYQDKMATGDQLNKAIEYVRNSESITEVILSGGDPLMVSDDQLRNLISQLDNIPHLKRLRIHTRLPVVIPQRVTNQLCQTLASSNLDCSIVLHINHGNEIDPLLSRAVNDLKHSGVTLLNQSVLLKHINDNLDALCELSERLFQTGILPYYLHCLDKVAGAAHFDLPMNTAKTLISGMRNRLPGYLVPRLAMEEPGRPAKTIVA